MAAGKLIELYTNVVENLKGNHDNYACELIKKKKNDDYESSMESNLTPENPWLLLPNPVSSVETLKFYNVFDSRTHDVKLPTQLQGGTVCGSSKGWLVVAKEIELFLFNPVSGDRHELPSLFTLPSFYNLCRPNANVKSMDTQTKVSTYICQIELSLEDPRDPDCVVAAILDNSSVLVCCKPNDKNWTVLHGLCNDHKTTSYTSGDVDPLIDMDCIGFCHQTLYVYVCKIRFSDIESCSTPSVVAEAFTVRVGEGSYMLHLKFLPMCLLEGDDQRELNIFTNIHVRVDRFIKLYMVESKEKNGQVVLIHKHLNHGFMVDEKDHDHPKRPYIKTGRFEVSKLIPSLHDKTGNSFSIERVNSLGDDGVLFVGGGSTLIHRRSTNDQPTRGNCVYFIDDIRYGLKKFQPYVSFDTGVCYLDDGKIKRPFPSVQLPTTQSRMFWFNPNNL